MVIIVFQEVWKKPNYLTIKHLVASKLPFSHFYDNGIIGTGTAIFSKVKIQVIVCRSGVGNKSSPRMLHFTSLG